MADATTIDLDTEEGRAFYQQRLAFLAQFGFFLSAGIMVLLALVNPAAFVESIRREGGGVALQVAKRAVFLITWLVCRRGRLPLGALKALDAGLPFFVCVASAVQSVRWPGQTPSHEWGLVLALTNVLVARSVFIPSPPWRTLRLGLLIAMPTVALSAFLPGAGQSVAGPSGVVAMAVWALCAIAISTMASANIYKLQKEVTAARQLGPYTLEKKLGEGGMGIVYRARHAMLRRPTAVKLLPATKAGDLSVRRFEREVQLTAQLSHPNTISVFDYGRTPDGVFFYAMEYLEGVNLEELVRHFGPQHPGRVAHILRQVAGSLAEAHAAGLIHRDVKPANVFLCERGGVPDVAKVLDFGLARDVERSASTAVTQVDGIAGTPQYLAPEAITAPETVDSRTDLYALGAVGYFLLAGVPVFEGRTVVEVCSHHLHTRPVPPSDRAGRPVPNALEALLLSCLEKDPRRRPQSAIAFAERLAACGDVGAWGEREARAWWTRNGDGVRAHGEGAGPASVSDSLWASGMDRLAGDDTRPRVFTAGRAGLN